MSWRSNRGTQNSIPMEGANQLFEKWIMEWKEDAISKNSKAQYGFSKALASLRKYPLPLMTGKDCLILENFGSGICNQLDQRLAKESPSIIVQEVPTHLQDILPLPGTKKAKQRKSPGSTSKTSKNRELTSDSISGRLDGQPPGRKYVPAFRSGGYAILITLLTQESTLNYRGYMLKSELLQAAQEHCNASMTNNPCGTYSTAWNSMQTLIKKNLVIKQGNPTKYTLTIQGRELAALLTNADSISLSIPPFDPSDVGDAEEDDDTSTEKPTPILYEPNSFEVLLCVDNSETNTKSSKDEALGELRKNGIPLEVMKLSVGDFVWICRRKSESASNRRLTISRCEDLILPYVVERKRMDDLASSIRDGRFREQKQRLKDTGFQPIYLIESFEDDNGDDKWGLAEGALMQAIANTQIKNGFLIHESESLKDTCSYLTHMTRFLSQLYKEKALASCTKDEWPAFKKRTDSTYLLPLSDFNEFGAKKTHNWTVSEMFARHLLKIKGISGDKAAAIIKKYPTPYNLLSAYEDCPSVAEQELLLASIRYGSTNRMVGKVISKTVHSLYTLPTFPLTS